MADINTDEPNDEPTAEEAANYDMAQLMQQYSLQFDDLTQKRHEAGQAEYGLFTFMENDVVRMMAEELADTANYCRMQFIKLMLINDALVDLVNKTGLAPQGGNIEVGVKAFKGTKTGWSDTNG